MSVTTGDLRPSIAPDPVRRPTSGWDRARQALVVGWLLVIAAMLVAGARTTSLGDLREAVARGDVDGVTVTSGLPARATGYVLVQVGWREGLWRHEAAVVEWRGSPTERVEARESARDQGATAVHGSLAAALRAADPGLTVSVSDHDLSSSTLLGWRCPPWLGLVAAALVLCGLGLLLGGPEPWRATRWAWFWLLVPPLGSIAFLLLSGPTPGLPRPKDGTRRLTGGWAFLLAVPLMAWLAPYRW